MTKRNILKSITDTKRVETEALQKILPLAEIRRLAESQPRQALSMTRSIRCRPTAIIAEHKRRSPSKGEISPMSDAADTADAYAANGAAAMSVLTDTRYFGGSAADLAAARARAPWLPLLRKDFIIGEYQVYEARLLGADAILLIAAILGKGKLQALHDLAHSLGMETLVEIHSAAETASIPAVPDMVGINNRDLITFSVDISNSANLLSTLPESAVKVAESGISTPGDIAMLKNSGFDAFLIGEALMSAPEPGARLAQFLKNT